jgi:predicted dehydrogenase
MASSLQGSTVNYAVVGTGFAGAAHVEALHRIPGAQVVSVVASSESRAREAAQRLGVPGWSGDYRTLLEADDVDVIDNCTPNHLHAEITHAALAAGKHVLAEKPLGMDSGETTQLAAAATRAPVVTGVCFNYRFFTHVQQAREMLTGARPHLIRGGYLQDWLLRDTDWNWRLLTPLSGASRAVGDIGSHWIDLIGHVTGRPIQRVYARLGRLHETRRQPARQGATFQRSDAGGELLDVDTEDFATVMFDLRGGCPGVFTVSQVSPGMRNRLTFEIDTPDATVAWDQERPNRLWVGHRDAPNEELVRDPALLAPGAAALTHYPAGHQEGWPDALTNLVGEFTRLVKAHGRGEQFDRRLATFAEADRVTRTVEAIVESGGSGTWVEVASMENAPA